MKTKCVILKIENEASHVNVNVILNSSYISEVTFINLGERICSKNKFFKDIQKNFTKQIMISRFSNTHSNMILCIGRLCLLKLIIDLSFFCNQQSFKTHELLNLIYRCKEDLEGDLIYHFFDNHSKIKASTSVI